MNIYSPSGQFLTTITPFPGYTGELRTVEADFNADGVPDLAVVTGPGVATELKVIDGATGATLFDTNPFGDFTGGVFVAAGNITGGSIPDLVVTPDQGGGPRVVGYQGGTFAPMFSFLGICRDPNFRGGARAAVGDVNGDGHADLIISAGFEGGPPDLDLEREGGSPASTTSTWSRISSRSSRPCGTGRTWRSGM